MFPISTAQTPQWRIATLALGLLLAAVLVGALPGFAVPTIHHRGPPGGLAGAEARPLGDLPPRFEPNHGQFAESVSFVVRGRSHTLFLSQGGEAVLSVAGDGDANPSRMGQLRLRPVGGDPRVKAEGTSRVAGVTNYLLGADPSRWRTGVPGYAGARYRELYPGIDMIYRSSTTGGLEYDFIVAPGADPATIALEVEGSGPPTIAAEGDLVVPTAAGDVRQARPVLFQRIGGKTVGVPGGFVRKGESRFGFWTGDYDSSRPLVIDPELVFSTYLGGSENDTGFGIAVDATGVYVAGGTSSADFPTKAPLQATLAARDAFVAKLDRSGQALIFATYIGGSGSDQATALAIDADGSTLVAGETSSRNFPTTTNAYRNLSSDIDSGLLGNDGFVAKLNPAGTALSYSTYLGGGGDDDPQGVAVGPSGAIYVTGTTDSVNFPVAAPQLSTPFQAMRQGDDPFAKDAFVARFNPSGVGPTSLVYATYLGGAGQEEARDVAVDPTGNAYVVGQTLSADFPTTTGAHDTTLGGTADAFVAKLNPNGTALVYSTYLGGADGEMAQPGILVLGVGGIAVDAGGRAYVTGSTASTEFPTTGGAFSPTLNAPPGNPEAFVARLNAAGSALDYSTYFGGPATGGAAEGAGYDVAIGPQGQAHVVGLVRGTDLPEVDPLAAKGGGESDAFVATFDFARSGAASLTFSTQLGGAGGDVATAVAVDANGEIVVTGATFSSDFPTSAPLQPTSTAASVRDFQETFVVAIAPSPPGAPVVTGVSPTSGVVSGAAPVVITGRGFTGTTAVHFGPVLAPGAVVESDSRIVVAAPRQAIGGPAAVTVTTPGGTSPPNPISRYAYGEGSWRATTAPPTTSTYFHSATLLRNGKVLVAGGTAAGTAGTTSRAAALFDPLTATWAVTGDLGTARFGHTATLLGDGRVLVVGGNGVPAASQAEIYDPGSGTWAPTANQPSAARDNFTATLLPNGRVLVAGGFGLNTAELFNPGTGLWTATGAMGEARANHSATLLANGKVLIAGGVGTGGSLRSAELYDPAGSGTFSPTGSLQTARQAHPATLLADGKVLVAGGVSGGRRYTDISETFDPAAVDAASGRAGAWQISGRLRQVRSSEATPLGSGAVLVSGGTDGNVGIRAAELFGGDSPDGEPVWRAAPPMGAYRSEHSAVLLSGDPATFRADPLVCGVNCGKVLVVGGRSSDSVVAPGAELYTPAPTISSVAPTEAPVGGGGPVTISGTGLAEASQVRFGATVIPAASFASVSYGQITVTAPPAIDLANVEVVVATPGGETRVPARFRYRGAPGAVTGLRATPTSASTIDVLFGATGEVAQTNPPATSYIVKQSRSPINPADFDAARTLCGVSCTLVPTAVGEEVKLSVTGLSAATTYYFAVRAIGSAGELGPIAGPAAATTDGVGTSSTTSSTPGVGTGSPGAGSGTPGTLLPRSAVGYRTVGADGGIFAFGDARFFGSTGALRLNRPIVGMAATPSGNGYWLVAADGGIFAFGDARFVGSTGAIKLNRPIVGMAATPSGNGYWLVAADGGIFAFGDARFVGSTGAIKLNRPIVGMAATPSGNGYWLVAADGGIFAFGDAVFIGSTGALRLNQPIVGMAATPSGNGYWLVAADGGIFAFGDAVFIGSTGALRLNQPIVGMAATPSGNGYWLVAADGGIFAFGDARFAGSTGSLRLNLPIVGMGR